MSPLSITAVIPAYNIEDFIDNCLASVAAQTFDRWRCIVIDDGSTDSTRKRALDWPDARVTVNAQSNRGVSAARNTGLAQAAGDFVMFLDGDDVLHPSALMRLQEGLVRNPMAVAAFGSFRKILSNGSPYPGEKPLARVEFPSGDVLDPMLRGNFLANGGHVLIRTDAARRAGGFDERLRLSEDWEFWCRLALQGPFVYIGSEPECLQLRVAPTSVSGGLAQDWEAHQPALDMRRFLLARRMMLQVLLRRPRAKRAAQFVLAEASRALNRPILSRYRFRDLDIRKPREKASPLEGRLE